MPWYQGESPVKMAALAGVQVGVELKALRNLTPREASQSRLGVFTTGLSAHPITSALIWSAMRRRTLGRELGAVLSFPWLLPLVDSVRTTTKAARNDRSMLIKQSCRAELGSFVPRLPHVGKFSLGTRPDHVAAAINGRQQVQVRGSGSGA